MGVLVDISCYEWGKRKHQWLSVEWGERELQTTESWLKHPHEDMYEVSIHA